MDYDGFHQMVLGANLIPIKQGSLDNINDYQVKGHDLNTHAALTDIISKNYGSEIKLSAPSRLAEDLERVPKSQTEFEKFFVNKLSEQCGKTAEDRFRYMINIPITEIATIFDKEVGPDLLAQILATFSEVVS